VLVEVLVEQVIPLQRAYHSQRSMLSERVKVVQYGDKELFFSFLSGKSFLMCHQITVIHKYDSYLFSVVGSEAPIVVFRCIMCLLFNDDKSDLVSQEERRKKYRDTRRKEIP
jgi:hypothetical protein